MENVTLTIGYTALEMKSILGEINLLDVMSDDQFGFIRDTMRMRREFGLYPGIDFYELLGKLCQRKTGNPDTTFYELYKQTGVELCLTVTNLKNHKNEYFHPKTTPNVSLRVGVRASSSIPGVFVPPQIQQVHKGDYQMYVDGGILVNFPLHVFDGWYLSMKDEDNFLTKLHGVNSDDEIDLQGRKYWANYSNYFKGTNMKTLGFILMPSPFLAKSEEKINVHRQINLEYFYKLFESMEEEDRNRLSKDLTRGIPDTNLGTTFKKLEKEFQADKAMVY